MGRCEGQHKLQKNVIGRFRELSRSLEVSKYPTYLIKSWALDSNLLDYSFSFTLYKLSRVLNLSEPISK